MFSKFVENFINPTDPRDSMNTKHNNILRFQFEKNFHKRDIQICKKEGKLGGVMS